MLFFDEVFVTLFYKQVLDKIFGRLFLCIANGYEMFFCVHIFKIWLRFLSNYNIYIYYIF